jgi:hypothetical protein
MSDPAPAALDRLPHLSLLKSFARCNSFPRPFDTLTDCQRVRQSTRRDALPFLRMCQLCRRITSYQHIFLFYESVSLLLDQPFNTRKKQERTSPPLVAYPFRCLFMVSSLSDSRVLGQCPLTNYSRTLWIRNACVLNWFLQDDRADTNESECEPKPKKKI